MADAEDSAILEQNETTVNLAEEDDPADDMTISKMADAEDSAILEQNETTVRLAEEDDPADDMVIVGSESDDKTTVSVNASDDAAAASDSATAAAASGTASSINASSAATATATTTSSSSSTTAGVVAAGAEVETGTNDVTPVSPTQSNRSAIRSSPAPSADSASSVAVRTGPAPTKATTTTTTVATKASVSNDDSDLDDDFEDETLMERVIALSEMFPDCVQRGGGKMFSCSVTGVKSLYSLLCNGSWIFFSSAAILMAPLMFELERHQMAEMHKQQQRQILLGPNAAVSGSPMM